MLSFVFVSEISQSLHSTPEYLSVNTFELSHHYEKGKTIVEYNEPDNHIYYIVRGKVKLVPKNLNQTPGSPKILCGGQYFGEEMLLGHIVKQYEAIALSNVVLKKFTQEEFTEYHLTNNKTSFNFIQNLIQKLN